MKLAIVGPGRVGRALGRRWAEAGIELSGYVGRSPGSAAAAVAFAGAGAELALDDLAAAEVVVFAVGDSGLPEAVAAAAAAGAVAPGSLWLHCSGRHDLQALAPASDRGAAVGGLHPVCPFPDAEAGYRAVPGSLAVLLGEGPARPRLQELAERAGLEPIWSGPGDRALYHAACALAANGLTALRSVVDLAFAAYGGLAPADAARLSDSLMAAALRACAERGAERALSGPVVRGDDDTLRAHRRALLAVPAALPVYRALLHRAIDLAAHRGEIDAPAAERLRAVIDAGPG